MSFGSKYGRLISLKRGIEGLTQEQLAGRAFEDPTKKTRISEIENGKVKNPRSKTIDALNVALNIDEREMLDCRTEEDDPFEFLRNLAIRFGTENPTAKHSELKLFLLRKCDEYRELRDRFKKIAETEHEVKEFMKRATKWLAADNFDQAVALLKEAESTFQETSVLEVVRKQSKIRTEMGNIELLRDHSDDATEHYLKAASYIAPFDAVEAANLRRDRAIYMEERAYFKGLSKLDGCIRLLQRNVNELDVSSDSKLYFANLMSLGASTFNKCVILNDPKLADYQKARECFEECLKKQNDLFNADRWLLSLNLATSLIGISNISNEYFELKHAIDICIRIVDEVEMEENRVQFAEIWVRAFHLILECKRSKYSVGDDDDIGNEKMRWLYDNFDASMAFNAYCMKLGGLSVANAYESWALLLSETTEADGDSDAVYRSLTFFNFAFNFFKACADDFSAHRANQGFLDTCKKFSIDPDKFQMKESDLDRIESSLDLIKFSSPKGWFI